MFFDKILLYQYGKVGSSSIRQGTINSKYISKPLPSYSSHLIQTHSHDVAEDVIKKHPDVLVIVIVRLPITRNLSNFWENIHKFMPFYKNKSIQQIDVVYKEKDFIAATDSWLDTCFKLLEIDKNSFKFNHIDKYNLLSNKIKTLLIRYEDLEFISKTLLPNFGIHVTKKTNVSSKKVYGKYFLEHKKFHTIDTTNEERIRSSIYNNAFYTDKELSDHIEEWSKLPTLSNKRVRFAPLPPSTRQHDGRQRLARRDVRIGMGGLMMR